MMVGTDGYRCRGSVIFGQRVVTCPCPCAATVQKGDGDTRASLVLAVELI